MVVMDIKIHMILEMSGMVMGHDDGSIFFQVAGSNAQVLSTSCHERSPSSVVQSDCSLPLVVFVVDGQASEGAKVVLVFSATVAVQGRNVGIIFI